MDAAKVTLERSGVIGSRRPGMAASSSTDELPADAHSVQPLPISLESMMAAMIGRLDMMTEEMATIRLTQVTQSCRQL